MSGISDPSATMNKESTNNSLLESTFLDLSLDMQQTLAHYILQGKGIQDLINKIAKKTGCCIVLEDSVPSILAVSFAQDNSSQNDQLRPYLSLQTSPSLSSKLYTKITLRKQLSITDQYQEITINRLLTPVKAGNELLGFLSFLKINTPYSELEMKLAQHVVDFLSALMAHDRKIAEIELKLKGNFVEDLISGNYLDIESIKARARALEYDITIPNRVLVAQFDEAKQFSRYKNPDEQNNFRHELVKKIQSVTALTAPSMAVSGNNEIIILVQNDKSNQSFEEIKHIAQEIIKEVSPLLKTKLYIGIGSRCSELKDYKRSYLTAKKALEIGEYMITEGQIRSFEQFKIHALFLSTLNPAELYSYARKLLQPLLDYDDKHNAELIKTLQEFLYLRNNVEGTAKSLNMSVSGIKYRLQKIQKITGYNLKDHKLCFDLQLALIILQLFGEYNVLNG